MTATVDIPRAELRAALERILGDVPETATIPWICDAFGITEKSVRYAIKTGKLPYTAIRSRAGGISLYIVRPEDALLLWGHRLMSRVNSA